MEAASTPERLKSLWQRNLVTLAMLKRNLPALKSDTDQHYADILTSLYKRCLREMHEEVSRHQGRAHQSGAEEKPETAGKASAADIHSDTEEIRYAPGSVATASAKSASAAIQGSGATVQSEKLETHRELSRIEGREAPRSDGQGKPVKADGTPAQIEKADSHERKTAGHTRGQGKLVKGDYPPFRSEQVCHQP